MVHGGRGPSDETVVPHKGLLAGPLKMFIARKPHPTGIKLYCLVDATWRYVVVMYLYTGVQGTLRRYGTAARNFAANNIMKLWASLLPEGTVICADSLFGSHGLAKELAASERAFLMMTKRPTYGVTWVREQVQEGQTAVCTVADFKYSLCFYMNPKVGHKPPRAVPMLTNVWFAQKGPPAIGPVTPQHIPLSIYHPYISSRRRCFIANGVARKVLRTRRARTTSTPRTDQVTRTERPARSAHASRGT